MPKGKPWHSRLRAARTCFTSCPGFPEDLLHRWHATQTIGEWFGNESVGERFEHVNHVRSLAQYVWRYGAFREDEEGTGRVPEPVAARCREHFETAVRYAARFSASAPSTLAADADPELARLVTYASRNPDIVTFSAQLVALHRAMLPYYVQMRYLTRREAAAFRNGHIPVLSLLRSPSRHPAEVDGPVYTGELPGDLSEALLGTFAPNIHEALVCRARSELFETLLQPTRPRTYTRYGDEFYDISDWAGGRARSVSCSGETRVPAVCRARTLSGRPSREASELRRRGDEIRVDPARDRKQKERELELVYGEIDGLFRQALPELRVLRRLGFELVDRPAVESGDAPARPSQAGREASPAPAVPQGACGSPGMVDVNRAGEAELDQLP